MRPPKKPPVRAAKEDPVYLARLMSDAETLRALDAQRAAILDRHGWKARLWARIARGAPDECWPWEGARKLGGHGSFTVAYDASGMPHRIVWQMLNGPIPPRMFVCHRCDNPPCCNPAHLWLGTQAENNRDCWAKGRGKIGRPAPEQQARGASAGNAKLSDAKARAIYRSAKTHKAMAERYGVSEVAIRFIRIRRTWRHATDGLGAPAYRLRK